MSSFEVIAKELKPIEEMHYTSKFSEKDPSYLDFEEKDQISLNKDQNMQDLSKLH